MRDARVRLGFLVFIVCIPVMIEAVTNPAWSLPSSGMTISRAAIAGLSAPVQATQVILLMGMTLAGKERSRLRRFISNEF